MSPMLPKVAHGGLNLSWWYDKISYAPVCCKAFPQAGKFRFLLAHRPFLFRWLGGWGYWSWYGVWGCKYMYGGPLEVLRIPFWPFLFFFSPFYHGTVCLFLHVLCLLSRNSKFPPLFLFLNHFFSCSMFHFLLPVNTYPVSAFEGSALKGGHCHDS